MVDVARVASRLTSDLRLKLPNDLREFVLRGLSHPTTDHMVVTEIDADFWHEWFNAFADYDPVQTGMIFELPEGFDTTPRLKEYGFDPALDRHLQNTDQAKLASDGVPKEQVLPSVGLVVPLPDPIPPPPTEVTRTVQVPVPQTVPQQQTVKISGGKPNSSQDNPNQDVNIGKGVNSPEPSPQA